MKNYRERLEQWVKSSIQLSILATSGGRNPISLGSDPLLRSATCALSAAKLAAFTSRAEIE
jgi:hypothetical protein